MIKVDGSHHIRLYLGWGARLRRAAVRGGVAALEFDKAMNHVCKSLICNMRDCSMGVPMLNSGKKYPRAESRRRGGRINRRCAQMNADVRITKDDTCGHSRIVYHEDTK